MLQACQKNFYFEHKGQYCFCQNFLFSGSWDRKPIFSKLKIIIKVPRYRFYVFTPVDCPFSVPLEIELRIIRLFTFNKHCYKPSVCKNRCENRNMFCWSSIHVCIDFQTHCVFNQSAFLFMSYYVITNFSGRPRYGASDKLGQCNIRLQDNFVLRSLMGSRLISGFF